MGGRRTKEEKRLAKYQFLLRLSQDSPDSQTNLVKTELSAHATTLKQTQSLSKEPLKQEKIIYSNPVRKDILKSLSLTSFILILELVLYFILR